MWYVVEKLCPVSSSMKHTLAKTRTSFVILELECSKIIPKDLRVSIIAVTIRALAPILCTGPAVLLAFSRRRRWWLFFVALLELLSEISDETVDFGLSFLEALLYAIANDGKIIL